MKARLVVMVGLALSLSACLAQKMETYATPETVEQSRLFAVALVTAAGLIAAAWIIVTMINNKEK